jgi:hypothetical protein
LNRQHPLFSPLGCLGGLLLIVGIGVAVFFTGGAIFSPGDLTSLSANAMPLKGFHSHAEFQNNCGLCHTPLAGVTADRCLACHADVGQERATASGLHGKLAAAEANRCQDCHMDHQGRDFNPNLVAFKKFDHAALGFTLDRHIVGYDGAPLDCQSCHTGGQYQFQAASCINCHGAKNADFMLDHTSAFGQSCTTCHDGADKTAGFDHAKTKFPLLGQHAGLKCAACHRDGAAPAAAATSCAGCHHEPAAHAGVFSQQDCSACHTTDGWSPARLVTNAAFRHSDTTFQLTNHQTDYAGQPITCAACHTQAAAGDFSVATQTCITCHSAHDASFMQQHLQQYGPNCMSCHDGAGNMRGFDHAKVFALDGKHAGLACTACHVDQKFKGTASACVACHQEPAIHKGIFGTQCQACHTTSAWSPAQLTQHTFPLDHGGQGEVTCQTCHTQTYTTYTCYGCHAHDEKATAASHAARGIGADRLPECAACHATGHKQGNS